MTNPQVRLFLTLATSEPREISLSNPQSANSLELIGTVKQVSSPYPDQPITVLTNYTVLATEEPDAFRYGGLTSPYDTANGRISISQRPVNARVQLVPTRGNADMRQRGDHKFITIPPPGQGSVSLRWSLAPEHLLRFYKFEGDLTKNLQRFSPGQEFMIEPSVLDLHWWTFGSLEADLSEKKFTPWSLPNSLPLVREPQDDESDEVLHNLMDYVDRRDIDSVISRWNDLDKPGPDVVKPPNVKQMKADGWVFGEPMEGISLTCDDYESAVFEFVK